MKNFTFIMLALLLISIAGFSQSNNGVNHRFEVLDPNTAGKIFRNPLTQPGKPKGSPYLQLLFAAAKVQNVEQKSFMRYNAFNDEFEFITSKNDTLVLDKIADFSPITFAGTNKKYRLESYRNGKNKLYSGYLIEVYEKGDYALYRKENVIYYEEKIAKTTLETSTPPKYVKSDDTYFLKNKDAGIAEFPNGKKELIKLFPDKKSAIEAFVKENKISFGNLPDLIKIIDFLATL